MSASPPRPFKPLASRTSPRERDVLILIAHGLSNTEISDRLHLSPATVKTHIAHVYRKLGARDRAQVAVIAHQAGIVRSSG